MLGQTDVEIVSETERAQWRSGVYLGTQVGWHWWLPYLYDGLFVRGNGQYRVAAGAFEFQRLLPRRVIRIELSRVRSIHIGRFHAGKYLGLVSCLRVEWEHGDRTLVSGFIVSRDVEETRRIRDLLLERCADAGAALSDL